LKYFVISTPPQIHLDVISSKPPSASKEFCSHNLAATEYSIEHNSKPSALMRHPIQEV